MHTFFFNLNKWDHYRTMPFLSPSMSFHLYTNIPHNEGIEAWRHFLNTHTLLGETGGESVNSAGYSLID